MTQEELEDAKATLARSPLEFAEIWGEKLIEHHDMAYTEAILLEPEPMETKDFFGLKTGERLPDPTSVNVSNMIEDMWGTYKDAVTSLLCELEAAAMDLEAGQNTAENLATIRRLLHSIKGDSGMTGFADVHNFCHQAETFFEEITDTSAKADMVLKAKDWIEAVINHVSGIDIVARKESHAQEAAKQRLKALVVDDDKVCR